MVKIININTKTRTIHVSNADGDIKAWRTTESGTHFPIKKGESTKEALDKFLEKKGKRYYRGSVVHKDIIADLGKASSESDKNVKHWESEVDKENKRKRKTPGYLGFAQKQIEEWKGLADRQRATAKELSGDFELDPEDEDMNKEFEEWQKSKQPEAKKETSDTKGTMKESATDWYAKKFKSDKKMAPKDGVTFEQLYESLKKGENIYEKMGVDDSIVRERVMSEIATRLGVDYDHVYDLWLNGGD